MSIAEKPFFKEKWSELREADREHLMETLSTELSESLEAYSPRGDLALLLCRTLKSKGLKESTDGEPHISKLLDFITAKEAIETQEGFSMIQVLKASLVQEDADKTAQLTGKEEKAKLEDEGKAGEEDEVEVEEETAEDTLLKGRVGELMKWLAILCYFLFMKQFLTRYGKHVKPPSKVSTHPLDI